MFTRLFTPFLFPVLAALAMPTILFAQTPAPTPAPAPAAETKPAPAPSLNEKEVKFQAQLADVVFDGNWFPLVAGKLGESKGDAYRIAGADKTEEGKWVIKAKMKYGDKEFEIPIPVRVEWADDTAVIIVKNLAMPGGGKYSARVMVHEGTYAGSWSGGDKAGMLTGVIRKP